MRCELYGCEVRMVLVCKLEMFKNWKLTLGNTHHKSKQKALWNPEGKIHGCLHKKSCSMGLCKHTSSYNSLPNTLVQCPLQKETQHCPSPAFSGWYLCRPLVHRSGMISHGYCFFRKRLSFDKISAQSSRSWRITWKIYVGMQILRLYLKKSDWLSKMCPIYLHEL